MSGQDWGQTYDEVRASQPHPCEQPGPKDRAAGIAAAQADLEEALEEQARVKEHLGKYHQEAPDVGPFEAGQEVILESLERKARIEAAPRYGSARWWEAFEEAVVRIPDTDQSFVVPSELARGMSLDDLVRLGNAAADGHEPSLLAAYTKALGGHEPSLVEQAAQMARDVPLPEGPLWSCQGGDGACAEEVSWPADDLHWHPGSVEKGLAGYMDGLWLCQFCSEEYEGDAGISLKDHLLATGRRWATQALDSKRLSGFRMEQG